MTNNTVSICISPISSLEGVQHITVLQKVEQHPAIKFFYLQMMHKRTALKGILKFTLKHLPHVSVQSPSSGSTSFELAKVIVVKIIKIHRCG
jgi:hypothetical protein